MIQTTDYAKTVSYLSVDKMDYFYR